MTYKLEKIDADDVQKILADADESKRRRLLARGGYFSYQLDLNWAVDRERDMYLLRAPEAEARSDYAYFYFHFQSCTYEFRISRFSRAEAAKLDELPAESVRHEYIAELRAAFAVLQTEYNPALYTLNIDNEAGDHP